MLHVLFVGVCLCVYWWIVADDIDYETGKGKAEVQAQGDGGDSPKATSSAGLLSNTPPATQTAKQLNFNSHLQEGEENDGQEEDEDSDGVVTKKRKAQSPGVLTSRRSAKKLDKKAQKLSPAGMNVYEYGWYVVVEWGWDTVYV